MKILSLAPLLMLSLATAPLSGQVTGTPGQLTEYETTIECGGEPTLVFVSTVGTICIVDRRGLLSFYSAELEPLGSDMSAPAVRGEWATQLHRIAGGQCGNGIDEKANSADGTWSARVLPDRHVVEVTRDGETTRFGAFGARSGLFSHPRGLAIRGEQIFVADTSNHRIQVFTSDGVPLYRFGLHQLSPREGEGRLHYPNSIAISPDGSRAFVAEPIEGRVQVFRPRTDADPPVDPARTWERADLPAHFGEHWGLNGEWLLISEPDAERVALLKIREGEEPVRVSELGGIPGERLGQFRNPGEVCPLPVKEGQGPRFLVHDRGNHRWQVLEVKASGDELRFDRRWIEVVSSVEVSDLRALNSSLAPRWFIGRRGISLTVDRDGTVLLAADETIEQRTLRGAKTGRRWQSTVRDPRAVYVDPRNHWIMTVGDRVHSPRSDRIELGEERDRTSIPLGGMDPAGVGVLAGGAIVISDRLSHRLAVLDKDGDVRHFIGSPGTGPGQFHHPRAIAIDDQDRIWVLDHGNHRGQVLDKDGKFLWAFGSRAYLQPIWDAERAAADGATPAATPKGGEE